MKARILTAVTLIIVLVLLIGRANLSTMRASAPTPDVTPLKIIDHDLPQMPLAQMKHPPKLQRSRMDRFDRSIENLDEEQRKQLLLLYSLMARRDLKVAK